MFLALLLEPEGKLKKEMAYLHRHYFSQKIIGAQIDEARDLIQAAIEADPDVDINNWLLSLKSLKGQVGILEKRLDSIWDLVFTAAGGGIIAFCVTQIIILVRPMK